MTKIVFSKEKQGGGFGYDQTFFFESFCTLPLFSYPQWCWYEQSDHLASGNSLNDSPNPKNTLEINIIFEDKSNYLYHTQFLKMFITTPAVGQNLGTQSHSLQN